MSNNFFKYILLSVALIATLNQKSFAQSNTICSSAHLFDGNVLGVINHSASVSSGELWFQFKISTGTANRYITADILNSLNLPTKVNYVVYGPFSNAADCNAINANTASIVTQGNNFSASVISTNQNCIRYEETIPSPHLTFEMNSSTTDQFYVLKFELHPGEATSHQVFNVSAFSITPTDIVTPQVYCNNYTDGVDLPCATNTVCETPITICSDFAQQHHCGSGCGSGLQTNRFYVLNILNANTTVTVSTFGSSLNNPAPNTIFSLSNQMIYGPCDPVLLQSSNLLSSQSGGVFSYTFLTPGNYLLVTSLNVDCPIVNIDFDNSTSCNDCPLNADCDNPMEICSSTTQEMDCDAACSYVPRLWYSLDILNPNTTVSFTVKDQNGVIDIFSYAITTDNFTTADCPIFIPGMPPNINPALVLVSNGNVTSGTYTFNTIGQYTLVLNNLPKCATVEIIIDGVDENCELISAEIDCETCIGSFAPIPGSKYLLSAWAKEEGASATRTSYDYPKIFIDFNTTIGVVTEGPYSPIGEIIDGWQRIEYEFEIPSDAIDMEIRLTSTSGDVLYDDVRVLPFNSNMKSFVYDPINMRLAAELDERHYATFYEYDEEGQLVRVKKETVRGVMTIQETKSNTSKEQ